MSAPEQLDAAGEHAYRRRMEERRARELADARRKVTEARRTLERREKALAAIEAYWEARG